MRYFADHATREVRTTENAVIAGAFLADGRYSEVHAREVAELLSSGYTRDRPHPTSARALGAWPPLHARR